MAHIPITLQSYDGDATNSVSYSGPDSRGTCCINSLKALAGHGDGGINAVELEAQIPAYFPGFDDDLPIIVPVSKTDFFITQTTVNKISSGKNIEGKFYNGTMMA